MYNTLPGTNYLFSSGNKKQMQYVGRAIGSVSKTWSSINPATLSGAIDVIVVEHPDGELACSPFHVRFGKFQILKPSQKKVEVIVNEQSTNIPMKLGDSGEAYFVFETNTDLNNIPNELLASPVVSAASSPSSSPSMHESGKKLEEPDFLDINDSDEILPPSTPTPSKPGKTISFEERAKKLNERLTQKQIPSKIDNNGDLLLDIEGYKPSKNKVHDTDEMLKQLLQDEFGNDYDISTFVKEDQNGNIRIVNPYEHSSLQSPPGSPPVISSDSFMSVNSDTSETSTNTDTTETMTTTAPNAIGSSNSDASPTANYIKTIRLSSDQLRCLDLKYGENDVTFSVDKGRAIVTAKLFLWKWDIPIVISDIDGTITKSDALGHVLTMIGKDWTHPGVAKLFTEIKRNGYNIMYLTARSAGQADSTRSYLRSILQDGCKLPIGPVILSPDRTMAALRREVILKKPEVFKIACLNDLRKLYFRDLDLPDEENKDELPTPFIAGFGNRITDALSYRTVGIPSSRIFTINPDGEVHMELLELAGYKSSYIHINELVDHFFPPVSVIYGPDEEPKNTSSPGSPFGTTADSHERSFFRQNDVKFTDVNFWRDPLLNVDDLSDISSNENPGEDDSRSHNDNDDGKSSKSNTSDTPTTPKMTSRDSSYAGSTSPTMSRDLGRQIYLELGSPLASPRLNSINTKELDKKLDRLNISQPSMPITQVSKVHVLDGDRGLNKTATANSQFPDSGEQDGGEQEDEDYMDDEFDEDDFDDEDDEFDEDEFLE